MFLIMVVKTLIGSPANRGIMKKNITPIMISRYFGMYRQSERGNGSIDDESEPKISS